MSRPNENGTYAITEQGDLGLGLTPVNESEVNITKDDKKDQERPLFSK